MENAGKRVIFWGKRQLGEGKASSSGSWALPGASTAWAWGGTDQGHPAPAPSLGTLAPNPGGPPHPCSIGVGWNLPGSSCYLETPPGTLRPPPSTPRPPPGAPRGLCPPWEASLSAAAGTAELLTGQRRPERPRDRGSRGTVGPGQGFGLGTAGGFWWPEAILWPDAAILVKKKKSYLHALPLGFLTQMLMFSQLLF